MLALRHPGRTPHPQRRTRPLPLRPDRHSGTARAVQSPTADPRGERAWRGRRATGWCDRRACPHAARHPGPCRSRGRRIAGVRGPLHPRAAGCTARLADGFHEPPRDTVAPVCLTYEQFLEIDRCVGAGGRPDEAVRGESESCVAFAGDQDGGNGLWAEERHADLLLIHAGVDPAVVGLDLAEEVRHELDIRFDRLLDPHQRHPSLPRETPTPHAPPALPTPPVPRDLNRRTQGTTDGHRRASPSARPAMGRSSRTVVTAAGQIAQSVLQQRERMVRVGHSSRMTRVRRFSVRQTCGVVLRQRPLDRDDLDGGQPRG